MYCKSFQALRIRLTSLGGKTVGNTMNLMSNDVNRFDMTPMHLHYLWIAPLQTIVIIYFLYKEMGFAGLYGVIAILIVIPIQSKYKFRIRTRNLFFYIQH